MTRTLPQRSAPALLSIVLSTLVIAGCAGPTPEATPAADSTPTAAAEATPTPTPEPAPPARVTVAAKSLTVTDTDGVVVLNLAYSIDPDVAITQLSEARGETPTALVEASSACSVETTVSSWGGMHLLDPASFAAGPGATFLIRVDGASTAAGVPIVAGAGFAVGDALATVVALPGVSTVDYGDWVSIYSELQGASFDAPEAWGVSSFARGGAVERISAPAYFNYDC
ncbi:MAG: hypothetical protein RL499_1597 [Actinomycetota bacterium]|jgi:hypothetical protein